MRPVLVNGLPLPDELVRLVESGAWRGNHDFGSLALFGSRQPDAFTLWSVASMERETGGSLRMVRDPRLAEIYGLASSRLSGRPVSDVKVVDVDLAVLIAGNYDEDAIYLDYRAGGTPSVLLSTCRDERPSAQAHRVADDIGEFALRMGIAR